MTGPRMQAPEPEPWMDDALCAQTDPELFFPDKNEPNTNAKTICAACPVTTQCLEYAMRNGIGFGVWGGLSARERSKLRRAAA